MAAYSFTLVGWSLSEVLELHTKIKEKLLADPSGRTVIGIGIGGKSSQKQAQVSIAELLPVVERRLQELDSDTYGESVSRTHARFS